LAIDQSISCSCGSSEAALLNSFNSIFPLVFVEIVKSHDYNGY